MTAPEEVWFVLSKAPLEAGEKILSFPMPEGLDRGGDDDECLELVTLSGRTIPTGFSSVKASLKVKFRAESVGFHLLDLYKEGVTVDGLGGRLATHNKTLEKAFYPSRVVPSFDYSRDTGSFLTVLPAGTSAFTDDLVLAALLFPASDPASAESPPGGGSLGSASSSKKTAEGLTGYWTENASSDAGEFAGATEIPQDRKMTELLKTGSVILKGAAKSQVTVVVGRREWSSSKLEAESGVSPTEVLEVLEEVVESCLAEVGMRSGLFSFDLADDPASKGRRLQPRVAFDPTQVPVREAKDSKFVLTLEVELPGSEEPQVVEFVVSDQVQAPTQSFLKTGSPSETTDPLEDRYPIAFVADAAPSDGFIAGRGPCNIMAMMLGEQSMVSKPCARPGGNSRLTAVLIDRFHEEVVFDTRAEIYLTMKFTKQERTWTGSRKKARSR